MYNCMCGEEDEVRHAGVIGSSVPWLDCPACNAITWIITVTEYLNMQGDIMTGGLSVLVHR